MRGAWFGTLVLMSVAGCQGPAPPVPVLGQIGLLTGRWEGEYGSRESGRSGSILFTLEAGTDTAHGDVVMVPKAAELPPAPRPGDPDAPGWRREEPAQALPIAFVRAAGGAVEGRLVEYRDPECGCLITTLFVGRLVTPDRIEGTFVSLHREMGREVRGWWRAERRSGSG